MKANCWKCKKVFVMGETGIVDNKNQEKPICDECAGVTRDPSGMVWFLGETEHLMADDVLPDGTIVNPVIVTRQEAFGHEQ